MDNQSAKLNSSDELSDEDLPPVLPKVKDLFDNYVDIQLDEMRQIGGDFGDVAFSKSIDKYTTRKTAQTIVNKAAEEHYEPIPIEFSDDETMPCKEEEELALDVPPPPSWSAGEHSFIPVSKIEPPPCPPRIGSLDVPTSSAFSADGPPPPPCPSWNTNPWMDKVQMLRKINEQSNAISYTESDLHPTIKDPLCDPNWPLATYWPVYISSFFLDSTDCEERRRKVASYFAYHGLLTRMVYVHLPNCDWYSEYQKNYSLYDILVYFTSQADAEKAIATCHRMKYFGYNLNFAPGREAAYFDFHSSVRFVLHDEYPTKYPQEIDIERTLELIPGKITFVKRQAHNEVIIGFETKQDMLNAVKSQARWMPSSINYGTKKQRFLEQDIMNDLVRVMETDSSFMEQKPKLSTLNCLFSGKRPSIKMNWVKYSEPKMCRRILEAEDREKKLDKQFLHTLGKIKKMTGVNREQKNQMIRVLKHSLSEELRKANPEKHTPKPNKEMVKLKQHVNISGIEFFLRQHGEFGRVNAKIGPKMQVDN